MDPSSRPVTGANRPAGTSSCPQRPGGPSGEIPRSPSGTGVNRLKPQLFVYSFEFQTRKSTEPRKAKKPPVRKPPGNPKVSKPRKKAMPTRRPEPTPAEVEARKENRHEYDRNRNNTPERRELHRRQTQDKRNEAKALGLCVDCWAPTIHGQIRCETCAEQHREQRRQAKKRASQQRNQGSGQTKFF